jgi:hypothetical protein
VYILGKSLNDSSKICVMSHNNLISTKIFEIANERFMVAKGE